MVPAAVDVARGRRHRRGVFRLRVRVRGTYALHDAAGGPGSAPDGALRFRLWHHEPFGDAHRRRFGLPERLEGLRRLLHRGHAGDDPRLCDDLVRTVHL